MATMSLVTPGGRRVNVQNNLGSARVKITSPLGPGGGLKRGGTPKGVRGQRSRRTAGAAGR